MFTHIFGEAFKCMDLKIQFWILYRKNCCFTFINLHQHLFFYFQYSSLLFCVLLYIIYFTLNSKNIYWIYSSGLQSWRLRENLLTRSSMLNFLTISDSTVISMRWLKRSCPIVIRLYTFKSGEKSFVGCWSPVAVSKQ